MAGIFSRGFGFPSTSLAAAAEATAKGSAGSRAGAGPRPARRPPPEEEKKNPRVGELRTIGRARLLGAGMRWGTDHCLQRVPPGRMLQPGLTPLQDGLFKSSGCSRTAASGNFLLGNRDLDAHINLSLHLRSKEVPLEEIEAAGTHESRSEGCGCERAREGESSRGRREREGARSRRRLHGEAVATLLASTAVSPATQQRRGESPRKVSLGATVTTAQKPHGQIAP